MTRVPLNQPYSTTNTFGVPDPNAKHGYHAGVDYGVGVGTKVYAPCSGTVYSTADSGNQGIAVQIFDGKYYPHVFHLSKRNVNLGDRVTEGQLLGFSGNTGISTGPHLHFGVAKVPYLTSKSINDYINPADYVKGGIVITKEQEQLCAIMATGSPPGVNYNYQFVGTSNLDGMLQFWQGQASKITAQLEKTLAKTATGSDYGAGYNSAFQGKPLASATDVQNMANFWLEKRSVGAIKLTPGTYQV